MSYETITYEISQSILTITLNRPETLNAFTAVMAREIIDAFERADADDEFAGHHGREGVKLFGPIERDG